MKKKVTACCIMVCALVKLQAQVYTDPNGNVGIGTTNPGFYGGFGSGLHVRSQYPVMRLEGSGADFQIGVDGGNNLQIRSSFSAGLLNITTVGNVGIGTTSPGSKLDVNGQITSQTGFISNSGTPAYSSDYQFRTSGTYRGRLIWYAASYASLPSDAISIENSAGVPIAQFLENGNTYLSGNVGLGTLNPHEKLSVNGTVLARKLKVSIQSSDWADYVFYPKYNLRSLPSLETYIQKNKHLPDVPSGDDVAMNGLDMGATQAALLRKIEELTLYVIEQDKKNQRLQQRIEKLESKVLDR